MVKKSLYFIMMTCCFLMTACKSTKSTGTSEIRNLSAKRIINNHYQNEFDRATINARLKATYKDASDTQSITLKMRVAKDSTIWMSGTMLGIPLAKIIITPTNVKFYEKLGKTYFDGDFELLSQFLGTEVDFDDVQNLILGQAIIDLRTKKYISAIDKEAYFLTPKKQEELFDLFFWLDSSNFKAKQQVITQEEQQRIITVSYDEYQSSGETYFPKKINVTAVDKENVKQLFLEYKTIEFDKKVNFPFSIPSGYEEIKLNE